MGQTFSLASIRWITSLRSSGGMLAQQLCCCSWESPLSCVSSSTTPLDRPLRWCLISKLRLEILPIPPFISWNSRIKLFRGISDDFWPDMLEVLVTHFKICLMKLSGALPSLAEWPLNLCKLPSGVNWLSIKEICQIDHHSSELLSAATQSVWRDSLLYLQEILKALMQLSKRAPKLSKTYSTTALLTATSLLHEVCTCVSSLSDGHCKEH